MTLTRSRGNALGGTLVVTILLFLFGLTLANLATFNLRAVGKSGQRQVALQAAEAGLNEVAILLSQNPQLGTKPHLSGDPDFDRRLEFEKTFTDGSGYRLTFDATQADWSYNNLGSFSSSPGPLGRTVPPGHALLLCEGWAPHKTRTVMLESLVRLEAFPYAVAGAGDILLVDSTVRGVGVTQSEKTGNLYGGGKVELSRSVVEGDVVHVGALVRSSTTISGRTTTSSQQTLPDFDLSEFDTSNIPGHITMTAFEAEKQTLFKDQAVFITGDVELGSRRANGTKITSPLGAILGLLAGPVDLVTGPLLGLSLQEIISITNRPEVRLENAAIYVDGDLTGNRINGTGAFFVKGEAKFINSRIASAANDRLTLFAEESIHLIGRTYFGGVMLTHGDVVIDGMVDVRGAIFAPGKPTGGGNVIKREAAPGGLLWVLLSALGLAPREPSVLERFEEQTTSASYWLALGGSGSTPVFTYWNQIR